MSKENHSENEPKEKISLGDLLRTEREKKGLTKSHLAEITKLREHFIDALENEDWEKLPARVFIKGFIRSYTLAIGSDTQRALRLFNESSPPSGEEMPIPLIRGTKQKNRFMYYLIPVLIVIAIIVYFITDQNSIDNINSEGSQVVSDTSQGSPENAQKEELPEQVKPVKTIIPEDKQKTSPQNTGQPEKVAIIQEEPTQVTEQEPDDSEKITEDGVKESAEEIITEKSIKEDIISKAFLSETVTTEPPVFENVLTATIKMRTYVRIIVDDNPPKEFIFKPGSNPHWTAKRGFEVTVGNAAGIDFDFNGQVIKDIGAIDKVKKLRFPDNFKTEQEE